MNFIQALLAGVIFSTALTSVFAASPFGSDACGDPNHCLTVCQDSCAQLAANDTPGGPVCNDCAATCASRERCQEAIREAEETNTGRW